MDVGTILECINDQELLEALYAYCFVLQNTLKNVDGLTEKDTDIAVEAIKAAKDIAFKYLGMKTEVARADIGNRALDALINKLTEVK